MALFGLPNNLLLFVVLFLLPSAESSLSPYLSPNVILRDFPRMINDFKIFAYSSQDSNSSGFQPNSPADLFHLSLLRSHFLTVDPERAHLFYISFSGSADQRSSSRLIRRIRSEQPFWNRTLGADHFFLSEEGIGDSSDRNLVELRKNSIQMTSFPAAKGRFIPHKDMTFPSSVNAATRTSAHRSLPSRDPEVTALQEELKGSHELGRKFCLFFYGFDDNRHLGDDLKAGCVPIIVTGIPIVDLPFSDVLRWSEIALVAPLHGGVEGVRRTMYQVGEEKYARMRETAIRASALFRWDPLQEPAAQEPMNAFYALLYQLWRRRHTVRYARWADN